MKRFSKCLRERVCDEMAKNEKALKMKRKKKQRENLGLGGGNLKVYYGRSLTCHYI